METVMQDLRYALRMMRSAPGFTLVAVLALALGIGANTAMFSLVDGFLLRPLPLPHPSQLVWMSEHSRQVPEMSVSVPDLKDWQQQNHVYQGIAGLTMGDVAMTGHGRPQRLSSMNVNDNFFTVLGVRPELGRTFAPDDDRSGAAPVAVLPYRTWQTRFGGDAGILGRVIDLDGKSFTVVGVLPASFDLNMGTDVYLPLFQRIDAATQQNRGYHPGIFAVARLKPGVTLAQAKAEMATIGRRLQQQYPATNTGVDASLQPFRQTLSGNLRPALLLLMGAVGLVLLIACANLASLLLARSLLRRKEMAIRMSLGAARTRVVRQLLTESVLLALIGAAVGIGLAAAGVRVLLALLPRNMPLANQVTINAPVLLFTALIAVLTGVLFGLAPALKGTGSDLNQTLRDGGRQSAGTGHHRLNQLLVIGEVALALMLLVGAGLLLRSFYRLMQVNPGFDARGVVTASVELPATRYGTPAQQKAFLQAVLHRMQQLPGLQQVSAINPAPFDIVGWQQYGGWQTNYAVEGHPKPMPGQEPETDYAMVSPDYFRAMHIPLLQGRFFTGHDDDKSAGVAIVDESFARKYWPGKNPVGQHIKLQTSDFGSPKSPVLTVVGVVGHTLNYGLDGETRVETYVPFAQQPETSITLVARTAMADPARIGAEITSAVQSVDPDQPVFNVQSMGDRVSKSLTARTIALDLLAGFAALALLLAALGLYGVISYSVAQRSHEIGIRMALGADRGAVLGMVLGQGMRLALAGVAIGLAGGLLLSQTMSSLLYGVRGYDPLTYAVLSVVLLSVAAFSAWLPARRATRVDPMVALRGE